MQGIGYKPPSRERLAGVLLEEIYLETKENVDTFFAAYDIIGVVFDKSNNQAGDRILNITVLTKDHEFFHICWRNEAYCACNSYLDARKNRSAHQIRLQKIQ